MLDNYNYQNIEIRNNIETLSFAILDEIHHSIYEYGANTRLNLSFYETEKEKYEYSIKRLEKFRKSLGKCKGGIADTIKDILNNKDNFFEDIDDKLLNEIQQMLAEVMPRELYEELPESDYEDYNIFLENSKFDTSFIKEFVKYFNLMMKYFSCEYLIESINTDFTNDNINTNPHPRIFVNIYAFKVFERWHKTVKNPLADYSFIYRIMVKDNLIYESIGDSEYRQWLSENYEVEIDKTKQLHLCETKFKKETYSTIKDVIKQK